MWPCTAAHESLLDHTLPHPTLPQSSWHLQNTPHLLPPQTLCTHSASARTFFPTCLQGSPLHFCRLALMSPSERQGQKGYCLGDSLPPLPHSVSFPCTGQPPVYQACICFCVHSLSSTVPGVCLAHNRWKEWMLNEWTPREKTAHFTSQTRRIKHGLETEFVIPGVVPVGTGEPGYCHCPWESLVEAKLFSSEEDIYVFSKQKLHQKKLNRQPIFYSKLLP